MSTNQPGDDAVLEAAAGAVFQIPPDVFCPGCAYDLRGAVGEKCSECGYPLANLGAGPCRIPWVRRSERGRFRTYWQTVWMVTFRNRRFCEEYARSVSYADARVFQWMTVAHVFVAALGVTVLFYLAAPPEDPPALSFFQLLSAASAAARAGTRLGPSYLEEAYAEVWPVAILGVCFLMFLVAATGVPSYFFHTRKVSTQRQNSAVAMSYYTCGPLAVVAGIFAIGFLGLELLPSYLPSRYTVPLAAVIATSVVMIPWVSNLVWLARRTMPHIKGRSVLVAVAVPALWLALGGLILIGLPLVILSVLVVFFSLG